MMRKSQSKFLEFRQIHQVSTKIEVEQVKVTYSNTACFRKNAPPKKSL